VKVALSPRLRSITAMVISTATGAIGSGIRADGTAYASTTTTGRARPNSPSGPVLVVHTEGATNDHVYQRGTMVWGTMVSFR
jgi:hypothetical protein